MDNIGKGLRIGMALLTLASGMASAEPSKAILEGFITRGDVDKSIGLRNGYDNPNDDDNKPTDWVKHVDGVVIQAEWATLEPEDGIYDFKMIKNALNEIKAYNEANDLNLGAKLRVFAGQYSPQHILNNPDIGSTYIWYAKTNKGRDGMLPHFWKDAFLDKYQALHQALAEEFDAKPEDDDDYARNEILREVSITACMMKSADMHRAENGDNYVDREDGLTNIGVLMSAGLTFEEDFSCQKRQINIVAKEWKNTWVSVARAHFNDYSNHAGIAPPEGEKLTEDWPLAKDKMKKIVNVCRKNDNCIIGNNSLEYKETKDNNAAFFDYTNAIYYVTQNYLNEGKKKAPVYFQTVVKVQSDENNKKTRLHRIIESAMEASDVRMIELPTLKALKKHDDGYLGGKKMQAVRSDLKN